MSTQACCCCRKTPEPIRFGVWGLGRIGAVHCRCFSHASEKYTLAAVCDLEAQRVDTLAAEYGCTGYVDGHDFLADPAMELVIIATRSLDHVIHARQALAAGKLVLLEKPIAATAADLATLRELNAEHPGKLFFGHNVRFERPMERIHEVLDTGVLGDIFMVKICKHFPYRRRADWQTILACGGGQLSCWGPHIIDHSMQFIKAPLKELWSNLRCINSPGDADNHVKLIMVGENGIVVDAEISDVVAIPGAFCSIYGERGSLVCADGWSRIQLRYVDPEYTFRELASSSGLPPQRGGYDSGETIPWTDEAVEIDHQAGWQEHIERRLSGCLYAAIREGVPFPIVNADALEVVRIAEEVKRQHPEFDWIQ